MPLRIVAKIAYVGAAWHVIGETPDAQFGLET